jgi:hypothetical protein
VVQGQISFDMCQAANGAHIEASYVKKRKEKKVIYFVVLNSEITFLYNNYFFMYDV